MKYLTPLGVGGILAGLIFFFYRKDALTWIEGWKGQSQMLVAVVKDATAAITALIGRLDMQIQVAKETTVAVMALIAKLEERERK